MSWGRWCVEAWGSTREPRDVSLNMVHATNKSHCITSLEIVVVTWPNPTAASEKWKGGGRDVNEEKERDKSKLSWTNRSHTPFNQVVLRREAIVT